MRIGASVSGGGGVGCELVGVRALTAATALALPAGVSVRALRGRARLGIADVPRTGFAASRVVIAATSYATPTAALPVPATAPSTGGRASPAWIAPKQR